MLKIRRATLDDVNSLAPRLREEDKTELKAVGHKDPIEALLYGLNCKDPTYVAEDEEGLPQIIFGTAPSPDPAVGYVWMVATEALKDHWIQVLRETRPWIDRIRGHYSLLANIVHADNKVHIRWLQWAGFTLFRKIKHNDHYFYEFAKLTSPEVT